MTDLRKRMLDELERRKLWSDSEPSTQPGSARPCALSQPVQLGSPETGTVRRENSLIAVDCAGITSC